MSRIIKINNKISFEPEKRRISWGDEFSGLSVSAALCLELLIDNAGELVTHQQLYDFAWRRFGMEPTSTSLYQNISSLRRTFSKTGLRADIIRTIPRRGFLLSSSIEITREVNVNPDSFSGEQEDRKHEIIEEKPLPQPDIPHTFVEQSGHHENHKRAERKYIYFFYATAGALLLMIVIFFPVFQSHNEIGDLFYPEPLDYKGCQIWLNSDSAMTRERVLKLAEKLNINCEDKNHLYMTAYKNSGRVSVFACQNPLYSTQHANCHSIYYIKKHKE
ncbi:winged helix-turn-helix domain-containing protein [Erwinia sp. HDF1-3R]|uniref:winged helix-turn-helix domain-containing protein n=1 Tax=Erwinia sp. HDF1-3R TaxID=3141543 RepID=UPI0031F5D73D